MSELAFDGHNLYRNTSEYVKDFVNETFTSSLLQGIVNLFVKRDMGEFEYIPDSVIGNTLHDIKEYIKSLNLKGFEVTNTYTISDEGILNMGLQFFFLKEKPYGDTYIVMQYISGIWLTDMIFAYEITDIDEFLSEYDSITVRVNSKTYCCNDGWTFTELLDNGEDGKEIDLHDIEDMLKTAYDAGKEIDYDYYGVYVEDNDINDIN